MSYGANLSDLFRRAAEYVDKFCAERNRGISRSSSQQVKLAIHLTAAKALGIEIPPSLLARADEVIE